MAYKNNLGKKLEVSKYSGVSITYELKYELDYKMSFIQKKKHEWWDKPLNSLNVMSKHEIEDYIEKYYIKKENIEEEDLISDLISCKSYKEKLDLSFKLDGLILSCLAILIAIITVMMSVILTVADTEILLSISGSHIIGNINSSAGSTNTIVNGSEFLIFFFLVILFIYIKWFVEAIPTNKINSLNNAIYILEAIKEDIYFQKEKESKEDECRYRVDLLNSLNSFKENKSDGTLECKNMRENKRTALNFTKDENETSLVNKASKISFLILFLFRMKKRMNDKR